jgi:hypothetical protein
MTLQVRLGPHDVLLSQSRISRLIQLDQGGNILPDRLSDFYFNRVFGHALIQPAIRTKNKLALVEAGVSPAGDGGILPPVSEPV